MKFSSRHLHYAICLRGDLWIPTIVRWHVPHLLIIENRCKRVCVFSGVGWALDFKASVSFWPVDTWVTSVSFIVLISITFGKQTFCKPWIKKGQCDVFWCVLERYSYPLHIDNFLFWYWNRFFWIGAAFFPFAKILAQTQNLEGKGCSEPEKEMRGTWC